MFVTEMTWIILLAFLKSVISINIIEKLVSVASNDLISVGNDAPIIGVMAQEYCGPNSTNASYIAASYIKFVEGSGARAVPIWIDRPEAYYESMLTKVNGVLFPGGEVALNFLSIVDNFNKIHGYSESGAIVYRLAKRLNDNGIHFPLFGTCLGFELLLYFSIDNQDYLTRCSADGQALPLNFTKDFRQSHIFGSAPEKIVDILHSEAVTANFHQFCLTPQNLNAYHLNNFWNVLSHNKDANGLEFISTIEHKRYPFYGVQFHPEKNLYEWKQHKNIPHTENAVKVAQYFGNFFVNECRKNENHFSGPDDENSALIYNYPVTFTGRLNSSFEQIYLFYGKRDG